MGTIYRNADFPEHRSILAELVREAFAEIEPLSEEEEEAAEAEAHEADREAADLVAQGLWK